MARHLKVDLNFLYYSLMCMRAAKVLVRLHDSSSSSDHHWMLATAIYAEISCAGSNVVLFSSSAPKAYIVSHSKGFVVRPHFQIQIPHRPGHGITMPP